MNGLKDNEMRQKLGIEKEVNEIIRRLNANDMLDLELV